MQRHFPIKIGYATQAIADAVLNPLDDIEVLPTNQPLIHTSATGMPVWDYIEINPSYVEGTQEYYNGYRFPATTVIEAIRPKKIVTTDIVGRDGTIDELVGLQDWELSIKGLIINYESTDYPEDEVRALQELCELKSTQLECEGTFLTMLGIRYLNIYRLSLPPTPGYSNIQKFEIEAKSKIKFILNP
ncbi:DUF6046 domain-containing protein [Riemerella anatipestifer]|uniref:DUF6046 domain-containing protein n=1 Tax=Riemerella anatipestifer TaxID=34085 RepID=UPI002A8E92D0|nr:DUF6046 domain-containing protein [Riemerella anatipestifer]